MSHRVIGADLSLTGSGLAWEGGVLVVNTKDWHGMRRLAVITRKVERIATTPRLASLAVIEAYSFGSQFGGERLGELGGCVRLMLHNLGVPYAEVAPGTLKKFAAGSGAVRGPRKVEKSHILTNARDLLGYQGFSFDEADALWLRALGMYALGQFDVTLPWPQQAKEACAAVEWPREVRDFRLTLEAAS
jgi:Holliday junction resolvasome RuvABC endonuclease subunit